MRKLREATDCVIGHDAAVIWRMRPDDARRRRFAAKADELAAQLERDMGGEHEVAAASPERDLSARAAQLLAELEGIKERVLADRPHGF